MGYTHYYKVSKEFDKKAFAKVAADFKKMINPLKHLGAVLADGGGQDSPIITSRVILFNGLEKCGHEGRQLGITWPSKTASGVAPNKIGQQLQELTKGNWFAGAELESRVCGGDCSHESFCLEQKISDMPELRKDNAESDKLIFAFTKTAYKPYDLAVNVCLVIAKHHLEDKIRVSSDGTKQNWVESMNLCHHFLGCGLDFELDVKEN